MGHKKYRFYIHILSIYSIGSLLDYIYLCDTSELLEAILFKLTRGKANIFAVSDADIQICSASE